MTQLLVFREYLQKFYQKHSFIMNALFRFLAAFTIFFSINRIIGYYPALNHRYVEFLLALVSIIMSGEVLLFVAAAFVIVHIFYVSHILALATALLFIILYLAYLKFIPGHAYIILAFPVSFSLNLVCGMPVYLGLILGPVAVLPIICGVSIYYLLQTITSVLSTSTDTSINLYQAVIQQFVENEEMYVMMIIFSAVAIVVYFLRTKEWDFSFEIAIMTGGILNMVSLLLVNYVFDLDVNMLLFFGGSCLSLFLDWLVQFVRLPLNYAGAESLQFEDDEYYYYVRAVPKMNIPVQRKHVKRFNSRKHSGMSDEAEEE